jgi:hypothetical protein
VQRTRSVYSLIEVEARSDLVGVVIVAYDWHRAGPVDFGGGRSCRG